MARTALTVKGRFRRVGVVAATVLALVIGTIAVSVQSGYEKRSASSSYHPARTGYGRQFVPTTAQQAATLDATNLYRTQIVRASESFVAATTALVADVRHGRLLASRSDELAAQGALDIIRPVLTTGFSAVPPLDALLRNQVPGRTPQGLHAVERALWSGRISDALHPAMRLAADGRVLEVLVYRTVLTPSFICDRLRGLLAWTVQNSIDTSQEIYSHRSLFDVAVVARSVQLSMTGIDRIGALVNPALTKLLETRTRQMLADVQRAGVTTVDQLVAPGTWQSLAHRMDALQMVLGEMSGALSGFGTGRLYA